MLRPPPPPPPLALPLRAALAPAMEEPESALTASPLDADVPRGAPGKAGDTAAAVVVEAAGRGVADGDACAPAAAVALEMPVGTKASTRQGRGSGMYAQGGGGQREREA